MKNYLVKNEITLGYGSHTRRPNPSRYKSIKPGALLTLDAEAANGAVWFIDEDGERGKIDCGEVKNLIRDGRITPEAAIN